MGIAFDFEGQGQSSSANITLLAGERIRVRASVLDGTALLLVAITRDGSTTYVELKDAESIIDEALPGDIVSLLYNGRGNPNSKAIGIIESISVLGDLALYPARAPYAVVPHDVNALPVLPKALYVGTGGTLVLRGVDGAADVTLKNVASGQVVDVRAQYVRATGTTAADIVALA